MKKLLAPLLRRIEESKDFLQKNTNLASLGAARKKVLHEFEKLIITLEKQRDLVREAIRRKKDLRRYRIRLLSYITPKNFRIVLSIPFIYMMILPAMIMDIFLIVYQNTCFRLYGIKLVDRKDHFHYDRRVLSYLNILEKMNCLYCSYFNGLMSYGREIAGRTERFWCPIKYAHRIFDPHPYYDDFCEYLDGEGYRKKAKNPPKFEIEESEK